MVFLLFPNTSKFVSLNLKLAFKGQKRRKQIVLDTKLVLHLEINGKKAFEVNSLDVAFNIGVSFTDEKKYNPAGFDNIFRASWGDLLKTIL